MMLTSFPKQLTVTGFNTEEIPVQQVHCLGSFLAFPLINTEAESEDAAQVPSHLCNSIFISTAAWQLECSGANFVSETNSIFGLQGSFGGVLGSHLKQHLVPGILTIRSPAPHFNVLSLH